MPRERHRYIKCCFEQIGTQAIFHRAATFKPHQELLGVLDVAFPLYSLFGKVETFVPFPPSVSGKNASGVGMLSGAANILPINVD